MTRGGWMRWEGVFPRATKPWKPIIEATVKGTVGKMEGFKLGKNDGRRVQRVLRLLMIILYIKQFLLNRFIQKFIDNLWLLYIFRDQISYLFDYLGKE